MELGIGVNACAGATSSSSRVLATAVLDPDATGVDADAETTGVVVLDTEEVLTGGTVV